MSTFDMSASETMETDQPDCLSGFLDVRDKFKKILGNDLILDKIASYVSITDLKQLSCANKYFLERVRSAYSFASLFGQKVTGEMEIHAYKLSRAIVDVDKLNRATLTQLAPEIFQETQHLEFQGLENLSDAERNFRLMTIVSNCQKLKSLTLGRFKILKDDYESFLRDENVKTVIANLKELHIGPTWMNYNFCQSVEVENTDEKPTYELFEEITKKMKLIKFTYTEPSILKNSLNPEFLLKNNRKTLKELNVAIDFKYLESLKTMHFLKVCKLELNVIQWREGHIWTQVLQLTQTENLPESLIRFLENTLPNLIEFQFGGNCCFALAPLCLLLEQLKYTKKLKVLGLKSIKLLKPTLDWSFLASISNLTDFKLDYVCHEEFEDDRDKVTLFLSALPSNINSIDLRGLRVQPRLDIQLLESSEFMILVKDPSPLPSLLLRFKNLTALKMHCRQVLDDKVVQFICQHLTQLKFLQADFTLVNSGGIIYLEKLKDLAELEINTHQNGLLFSADELVNSVRCLHLVKLTVKLGVDHHMTLEISDAQLLQLLSQSPRLECVNLRLMSTANIIREDVLMLYPRFKWQWE